MDELISYIKSHQGLNVKWIEREAKIPQNVLHMAITGKRKLNDSYCKSLELALSEYGYGRLQTLTEKVKIVESVKPVQENKQAVNDHKQVLTNVNEGYKPYDDKDYILTRDGKVGEYEVQGMRSLFRSAKFEEEVRVKLFVKA